MLTAEEIATAIRERWPGLRVTVCDAGLITVGVMRGYVMIVFSEREWLVSGIVAHSLPAVLDLDALRTICRQHVAALTEVPHG